MPSVRRAHAHTPSLFLTGMLSTAVRTVAAVGARQGHGAPLAAGVHTLVLMRHGQSEWNKANLFTGWHDVELTTQGEAEAAAAGKALAAAGHSFDVAFTSVLKRAIRTLWLAQEGLGEEWVPTTKDWRLNERHYGALTGLDKGETAAKYGQEQVDVWRRSYETPPPELDTDSPYWPGHDRRYAGVSPDALPLSESLSSTLDRVLPAWEDSLAPALSEGKRVLVVAHGNSLRALVKHLDGVSEEDIVKLNIPTGVPMVYHLDEYTLRPVPHGEKSARVPGLTASYVGNPDAIAAEVAAVAAQAKA